jgi:hypothetical protein
MASEEKAEPFPTEEYPTEEYQKMRFRNIMFIDELLLTLGFDYSEYAEIPNYVTLLYELEEYARKKEKYKTAENVEKERFTLDISKIEKFLRSRRRMDKYMKSVACPGIPNCVPIYERLQKNHLTNTQLSENGTENNEGKQPEAPYSLFGSLRGAAQATCDGVTCAAQATCDGVTCAIDYFTPRFGGRMMRRKKAMTVGRHRNTRGKSNRGKSKRGKSKRGKSKRRKPKRRKSTKTKGKN